MTFFVALAITLAFFIGSWMWVMPTRQQKRLAALRQRAIVAGFRVKFISLDDYQQLLGKDALVQQTVAQRQMVRYSKSWPKAANLKLPDCHFQLVLSESGTPLTLKINQQLLSETQWPSQRVWIQSVLDVAQMMEGLEAVVFQRIGNHCDLSFYWQEQGDFEKVDFKAPVFESLLQVVNVLQ